MDTVLDIAFVIAVTAFMKEQIGLKGKAVLLCAFLVVMLFACAPLIAALVPALGPFLEVFYRVVVLFLGAAGAYDAVTGFTRRKAK